MIEMFVYSFVFLVRPVSRLVAVMYQMMGTYRLICRE